MVNPTCVSSGTSPLPVSPANDTLRASPRRSFRGVHALTLVPCIVLRRRALLLGACPFYSATQAGVRHFDGSIAEHDRRAVTAIIGQRVGAVDLLQHRVVANDTSQLFEVLQALFVRNGAEDDGHYLLKCPPHAISNGEVLEVSQVKTLFTTSREVADYITDADLWWERVFVPSVDNTDSISADHV